MSVDTLRNDKKLRKAQRQAAAIREERRRADQVDATPQALAETARKLGIREPRAFSEYAKQLPLLAGSGGGRG